MINNATGTGHYSVLVTLPPKSDWQNAGEEQSYEYSFQNGCISEGKSISGL